MSDLFKQNKIDYGLNVLLHHDLLHNSSIVTDNNRLENGAGEAGVRKI